MHFNQTRTVRKLALFGIGALALPIFAACGADTALEPTSPTTSEVPPDVEAPVDTPTAGTALTDDDLNDVVSNTPSLSTLAEALDEAELQDTLEDGGPFTIFAPSNEAFAALPPETLQQLLQDENRETLRQILSYHVVPGQVTADQLVDGELPSAVAGEALSVQTGDQVTINNATVIEPDILARNGVVHIIDQVMLPPGVAL